MIFTRLKSAIQKQKIIDVTSEATEAFNVVRIGGRDMITYNGVVITRETDTDILERLNELREMYVKAHCRVR